MPVWIGEKVQAMPRTCGLTLPIKKAAHTSGLFSFKLELYPLLQNRNRQQAIGFCMLFQTAIGLDAFDEAVDIGKPFHITLVDRISIFGFPKRLAGLQQFCPIVRHQNLFAVWDPTPTDAQLLMLAFVQVNVTESSRVIFVNSICPCSLHLQRSLSATIFSFF